MKKMRLTVLLMVLVAFFAADTLLAFDVVGQGNAVWGDSKSKCKRQKARKMRNGDVVLVEERTNWLVFDYIGERIRQKKYEYHKGGLVRIYVYYNNPERRILNTYKRKYGRPTLVGKEWTWTFPSSVITFKRGSQRVVFRDRSYKPSRNRNRQGNGAAQLSRVKVGMTTAQVRNIMGNPSASSTQAGGISYFRYPTGIVTFKHGRVIRITNNGNQRGVVRRR